MSAWDFFALLAQVAGIVVLFIVFVAAYGMAVGAIRRAIARRRRRQWPS